MLKSEEFSKFCAKIPVISLRKEDKQIKSIVTEFCPGNQCASFIILDKSGEYLGCFGIGVTKTRTKSGFENGLYECSKKGVELFPKNLISQIETFIKSETTLQGLKREWIKNIKAAKSFEPLHKKLKSMQALFVTLDTYIEALLDKNTPEEVIKKIDSDFNLTTFKSIIQGKNSLPRLKEFIKKLETPKEDSLTKYIKTLNAACESINNAKTQNK